MEKNKSEIDITSSHTFIKDGFSSFYRRHQYEKVPEAPILAKYDDTVIFTGATITPFMPILREGVKTSGVWSVQPCLRTNNVATAYDENNFPEYMSYFTMCGTLTPPHKGDETVREALSLLTETYQIPKQDIIVRASSRDKDLTKVLITEVKVEENTMPPSYYDWKYGRDHINGRGITFAIRGGNRRDFRDIGNIVAVTVNQEIAGYEFGFGVETLLSRIYGLSKPIDVSTIYQATKFQDSKYEKFMDLLAASVVMYQNGIEPGMGKEKHLLKSHLKALSFWQRKLNISLDDVKNIVDSYSKKEFGVEGENSQKIIHYLKRYNSKIVEFEKFVANQIHATKLRDQYNKQKLQNTLLNKAEYYQLTPVDAQEILNKLLI